MLTYRYIMITSKEAIQKLFELPVKLQELELPLEEALNYTLSENIHAPISFPPFNQSAMDGFAIKNLDRNTFEIMGESKAGKSVEMHFEENQAYRVFTGAMVPPGSEAVIRMEDTVVEGNHIQLNNVSIEQGQNIRLQGEQLMKDDLLVKKGTYLSAGVIGYLAMFGLTSVKVTNKPKVTLVVTGDELVQRGEELSLGQIYESNAIMIKSACETEGIECSVIYVKDDLQQTNNAVQHALEVSDLVLTSGGISVGNYDFVYKSLAENGVQEIFYKVEQKPGKPIYAGKKGNSVVISLPGNPAAALTCFYIYVIPVIRKFQGRIDKELIRVPAKLQSQYYKSNRFTHFLKAHYVNGKVNLLARQSSAMLGDFSEANCIAILEGDQKEWYYNDECLSVLIP